MFTNTGPMVNQLMVFGFLIVPIFILIVVSMYIIFIVRRMEKRSERRLELDKDNRAFQQQQINTMEELNTRLKYIENRLKEVD
ncbi:hypothetical protein QA612_19195 [Evansella sp. AB-P1]|uniref:hypothetical protein n=1 Tax=Evansella sp. AB-P1 TaxID=3037653 RepID=UPI00241FCF40|nr:hypothetical protein [Evansella sp. AB-P1]MDG5789589.1 hypothetical protein [Evansella sp. AB-P1]